MLNNTSLKKPNLKIFPHNVEAKREEMKLIDFDLWNTTQVFWNITALNGNFKSVFEMHLDPQRTRIDWVDDDTIVNIFHSMGTQKHYWLDLVESSQTVFFVIGWNADTLKVLPV